MSNVYADAKIPDTGGKYLKLSKQAECTFRVLGEPIMGTVGWKKIDGKDTPIRVPIEEAISVNDVDDPSNIKYFWAMVVYHNEDKQIKILDITQKTVLKAIKTLASDDDYGDPINYDIKVSKTGEGLDTEYQVTPKPPKKLDDDIAKAYKEANINLNALYTNDDPFANPKEKVNEMTDKDIEKVSNEV